MVDAKRYESWAVIAGGSEGVGMDFARKLAASGINLVFLARKPGPLNEVAAEICAASGMSVRSYSLDLTAEGAADRVKELTDDIDVGLLIYNAGAEGTRGNFLERDVADATRMIAWNISMPTILSHHFGRRMRAQAARSSRSVAMPAVPAWRCIRPRKPSTTSWPKASGTSSALRH
jgi:short-subunit dehydrogenase